MIFADQIQDARFVQMLAHVAMEASKDEGNGLLAERVDQLGEHTHAGRVYVVERLCVEYQPAYGRLSARDGLPNAPLDVVRIREKQAIIQPVDQHSGNGFGRLV